MSYSREDAKKPLPRGWHGLVDEAFELATRAGVKVIGIVDVHGRIAIRTRPAFTGRHYFVATRIENASSETCMHCGRFAKLRTGDWVTILCEDCWEAGIEVVKGHTIEPE